MIIIWIILILAILTPFFEAWEDKGPPPKSEDFDNEGNFKIKY